jgi:hypothetical protein
MLKKKKEKKREKERRSAGAIRTSDLLIKKHAQTLLAIETWMFLRLKKTFI